MASTTGRCLCGAISFEADVRGYGLYRCHCSLCRRQSGAASNAATIIPRASFRWLSGEHLIRSWVKSTGFRSSFCSHCGSPVPNPLRESDQMWIPVGLLEDTGELRVVVDMHVASAASWDASATSDRCFDATPPPGEIFRWLRGE